MTWRPADWDKIKCEALKEDKENDGFETGADAMYKVVKEQLTNYWSSMDLMYIVDRLFETNGE